MKIPENSLLRSYRYNHADSYEQTFVSDRTDINSTTVGKLFFSSGPKWMDRLFMLRNRLVRVFGLKTSGDLKDREEQLNRFQCEPGEQLGLFNVFEKNDEEVIIGEDDKHLNFRVSLLLNNTQKPQKELIITTIVQFNSRFGRFYFAVIKPFHTAVVRSMVKGIIRELQVYK